MEGVSEVYIFGKTPLQWVNEMCVKVKTRLLCDIRERETYEGAAAKYYDVRLIVAAVDGQSSRLEGDGSGPSKKVAKQSAALAILNAMGITKSALESGSITKQELNDLSFASGSGRATSSSKAGFDVTSPKPKLETSMNKNGYNNGNGILPSAEESESTLSPPKRVEEGQHAVAGPSGLAVPKKKDMKVCRGTKPKGRFPTSPSQGAGADKDTPEGDQPDTSFDAYGTPPSSPTMPPRANGGPNSPNDGNLLKQPEKIGFSNCRNYVGALSEYCTKHVLLAPQFQVIEKSGPPHLPTFKMTCTVGRPGIPEPYLVQVTEESNLKNIKQLAAFFMLDKINLASKNGTGALAEPERERKEHLQRESASVSPKPEEQDQTVQKLAQLKLKFYKTASGTSGSNPKLAKKAPTLEIHERVLAMLEEWDWEFGADGAAEILAEVCAELSQAGLMNTLENKIVQGEQYFTSHLRIRIQNKCLVEVQGTGKTENVAKNSSAESALRALCELQQ